MIVKLKLPADEVAHEYTFHRTEVLIGSSRRTDLYIPLANIGLRHARLLRRGDRIWLEPLKPDQVLIVERAKVGRIKSSSPIGLLPGDSIVLGEGDQSATVQIVSTGGDPDLEMESKTLCRLSDESAPPRPELLRAVNCLAVTALDIAQKQELIPLLQPMVQAITGIESPPVGLVLFGTAREAPQFLIPDTFHHLVSGTKTLVALADWKPRITERLGQGEVLLLPSDQESQLVLVPITAHERVVGVWCFLTQQPENISDWASIAGTTSKLLLGALDRLDRVVELRGLRAENRYFRDRERQHYLYKELVTESPSMKAIYEKVRQLVDTWSPVLIQGEKGTGKEMIARALHHLSKRADTLMISQNCAGLTEQQLDEELFGRCHLPAGECVGELKTGLLELVHSGTLFLEEIDRLPMTLQTKLVRVISEREVRPSGEIVGRPIDVRLVVSTEQDLFVMVQSGEFRKDLYLQLADQTLRLPPLRERLQDIVPLANVFTAQLAARYRKRAQRVSADLRPLLERYSWPGNVRELQGAIEASVIAASPQQEEIDDIPGLAERVST